MSWQADSVIGICAAESRRGSAQFPGFRGPMRISLGLEELTLRSVLADSGTPRLGCRTAVLVTKLQIQRCLEDNSTVS